MDRLLLANMVSFFMSLDDPIVISDAEASEGSDEGNNEGQASGEAVEEVGKARAPNRVRALAVEVAEAKESKDDEFEDEHALPSSNFRYSARAVLLTCSGQCTVSNPNIILRLYLDTFRVGGEPVITSISVGCERHLSGAWHWHCFLKFCR